MVAKTDGTGGIDAATVAHRGRWAFAALLGGNMVLAVGAPLVRLADTGPIATGFWRMAIALPFLALLGRSEEHTSELQSLMRISYAVFCLKKKKHNNNTQRLHR